MIRIVSAVVMIAVSYATREPYYARCSALTFGVVSDEDRQRTRAGWGGIDVVCSALVLVLILVAYLYFQG